MAALGEGAAEVMAAAGVEDGVDEPAPPVGAGATAVAGPVTSAFEAGALYAAPSLTTAV